MIPLRGCIVGIFQLLLLGTVCKQCRHHFLRRGDAGPADGTLPPHLFLDAVARPPSIQAPVAERMAAGQVQRIFRVLEAYPARLFRDGISSADQVFGHVAILAASTAAVRPYLALGLGIG